MATTRTQKRKFKPSWLVHGVVWLVILIGCVWMIKTYVLEVDKRPKRHIQPVTLLKPPPPPPPVKEKLPEPEVPKEQEMVEPQQVVQQDNNPDEPPAGADLGVDADGSAGGDSFGLVGRKGGRALVGGGGGGDQSSLLRKYAWYTRMVQDEIRRELKRRLEKAGGWPDTGQMAKVKVVLDADGRIVEFSLVAASGDKDLDQMLLAVLPSVRVKEPPPPDMPLSMLIKVTPKS